MPEARARVILAFDFGLRRIGIAAGSTVSGTAAPLAVVKVSDRGIDWNTIKRLVREYQPNLLVLGNPLNADGSAGALTAAADRFAADLAAHCNLPVYRTDEYASSVEATTQLIQQRQSGQRRRIQRADIDGAAAAIILERWLRGEGNR